MKRPALTSAQSDLLSKVRVALNSHTHYPNGFLRCPEAGGGMEYDSFGQIDYAKVGDIIGRSCKGNRIPAEAEGIFTAHNGIVIKLYRTKGRIFARSNRKGWKRLFVICPCGTEVEAGHYHQHVGSKDHEKGMPKAEDIGKIWEAMVKENTTLHG